MLLETVGGVLDTRYKKEMAPARFAHDIDKHPYILLANLAPFCHLEGQGPLPQYTNIIVWIQLYQVKFLRYLIGMNIFIEIFLSLKGNSPRGNRISVEDNP